ncbi:MAG: tRNA uridine-5-carboxymethylaminomethyl(34) synthesis GTPase MnmE [Firmicutes bacterium]|nr:tRNA uridine-5-carboxymethylaminomethyl(34) synthesis GTPase MnmE [Bacillota bacterium]
MEKTTIAAIATPIGNGGVGIIRLSGSLALDIVLKCFTSKTSIKPRYATYGTILTPDFSDDVIVIYFPGPRSFTGENVVEIQAHGGAFLLQKLVEHLLTLGATLAQPGEFSKRAFLNGKISLDQAESIMDKIAAESESQLKAISLVSQGALSKKLFLMEKELLNCLAQIETILDQPDDDIDYSTVADLKSKIASAGSDINSFISSANEGRIMSSGIQIAVIGRPNVGKSSLFNAIINRDRSIVTNIEGTTTDTITESILYKGVKLVFNDTAGQRDIRSDTKTNEISKIEEFGIQRSRQVMEKADIILAIFDGSCKPTKQDIKILDLLDSFNNKQVIFVLNKSDLTSFNENTVNWDTPCGNTIFTSAVSHENISKLKELVYSSITESFQIHQAHDTLVITSTRHLNELALAYRALVNALENINGLSLDMIATDITTALDHLGNISGTNVSDAVIDEIFSNFCIGK